MIEMAPDGSIGLTAYEDVLLAIRGLMRTHPDHPLVNLTDVEKPAAQRGQKLQDAFTDWNIGERINYRFESENADAILEALQYVAVSGGTPEPLEFESDDFQALKLLRNVALIECVEGPTSYDVLLPTAA